MKTYYNLIAGQSLERLAALSDGIFAVAMTLLVLDLRIPIEKLQSVQPLWGSGQLQPELALWKDLVKLAPGLLTYVMSFVMLGIFWVGQQTQFNHFARSNRPLTWIHLIFLLAISLMPFSTALLANNITIRIAMLVYWFNIFLPGAALFGSLRYAWRTELVKDEMTAEVRSTHERRIAISQALYAVAALLCVINNYWSIAFIILVQIANFIIRWW
jgi:uncharacterized membrane protein